MTPDGFKETEIGPIPVEWEMVLFEDAILRKRVRVGKAKKSDYEITGKFPVIDQGKRFVAGYWSDPQEVYTGDLPVIVFGDHTRIFKFVDFHFVAGADGVKVLLPNTALYDPRFLFYALTNLEIPSKGYNRHFSLLKEQILPLPPLPEQRRISHVLGTIQQAIAAQDALIAAARGVKRSLMQRLFTYGPGSASAPTKETEVGEIPEHWEIMPLGKLCEFLQYGTSQRCTEEPRGAPVLRIPNVVVGKVDIGDLKFIELPDRNADRLRLKIGDLLFVRTNGRREYTGRCAVFKGELPEALFASYLIRARLKPDTVLPDFAQLYTMTPHGKIILERAR